MLGTSGGSRWPSASFPPDPPSYINMSSLLRVERAAGPMRLLAAEYERSMPPEPACWRLVSMRSGEAAVLPGPRPRFNRRAREQIVIKIKIRAGRSPNLERRRSLSGCARRANLRAQPELIHNLRTANHEHLRNFIISRTSWASPSEAPAEWVASTFK